MQKLHVVVASTRPGRAGLPIAEWFAERARAHGKMEVELVDLLAMSLPLLDEPKHPRLQQYEHEHTKRWSAKVKEADAFAFVTPEYNFSPAPALVNAIDYLFTEWKYKPVGFVSYGGLSAGLRAVQAAKMLVTSVGMMPILDAVAIPFFSKQMQDGKFVGSEENGKAAAAMLDELARCAAALAQLRA